MESRSRVAAAAALLGYAALAAAALGPLGVQIRLLPPMLGFLTFGVGLLLALIGLVVGAIGLWTTRAATGLGGRRQAFIGLCVGLLAVSVVAVSRGGGPQPQYNDITTDLVDPPEFTHAQTLAPNADRDLAYPAKEYAAEQVALYPDLQPIALSTSADETFDKAVAAATDLGWEITHIDREHGWLEAVDTSRIFRFVDDIAIRIRADAKGVIVDVRSKSRDGRSDLGVNAARIRKFREAMGG